MNADDPKSSNTQDANETHTGRSVLKRGAIVTNSMREAVGTIRQKFRMSTRRLARLQSQTPPGKVGKRRHTLGGKDVKMSSPFRIDTPNSKEPKACFSMETPTRLRREVEALTSNMQALSALTPNTLHARSKTRKGSPLTNGSLKTPRPTRSRVARDIY
ncbi:hypothetical protein PoB_002764700 [Plakobranchus ocellatus]|uniref:Uncharacterized protein n=1 Tax=Plakobranchus ocellatus TaxID=259542 RepID=A0AAV4A2L9_9GAST|nr:hypothetical protein PoB_002764700 [Plakobranchus ocellatus]